MMKTLDVWTLAPLIGWYRVFSGKSNDIDLKQPQTSKLIHQLKDQTK